jgi:hypothetical protein
VTTEDWRRERDRLGLSIVVIKNTFYRRPFWLRKKIKRKMIRKRHVRRKSAKPKM